MTLGRVLGEKVLPHQLQYVGMDLLQIMRATRPACVVKPRVSSRYYGNVVSGGNAGLVASIFFWNAQLRITGLVVGKLMVAADVYQFSLRSGYKSDVCRRSYRLRCSR